MPERVQRKRTKGWKLPFNTVCVTRPGPWGNYAAIRAGTPMGQAAVDAFRAWIENEAGEAFKGAVKSALRGKNLACWCKLDHPCHADVLLELANES